MPKYKRRKTPLLSDKNVRDRRDFAIEYADYSDEDWEEVLFYDETEFTLSERQQHGVDYIWTDDSMNVPPILRPQNEQKYMVGAGFTSRGVTKLYWLPPGSRLKAADYINKALTPMTADVQSRTRRLRDITKTKLFADNNSWTYLQDGAPGHTANVTQQWLDQNVPYFINKHWWPGIVVIVFDVCEIVLFLRLITMRKFTRFKSK